jgi:DNA modification methylase
VKPYYEDDAVTIYHGDCRDILPEMLWDEPPFSAIVTDPPYGVDLKGKATKHTAADGIGYRSSADSPEYITDVVVPIVSCLISTSVPMVMTPGIRSMFRYPEPRSVGAIFYPSGAGSGPWGFICSQPIFYYGADPYLAASMGSRPDSFSSTEAAEKNGHPCPKPIRTMEWLVRRASLPGAVVLDPFMGSGTTLRAAKNLGRKAIGIEIDERYCEIATRRMGQEVLDFGGAA